MRELVNKAIIVIVAVVALAACMLLVLGLWSCLHQAVFDCVPQKSDESALQEDPLSEITTVVPIRGELKEYSWHELAQISDAIASTDDEAGMQIAEEYNLWDLGGFGLYECDLDEAPKKSFKLEDGTKLKVCVADVGRVEGGLKTGLTFMAASPVGMKKMFEHTVEVADWERSGLRAWLNGEFAHSLPQDLQDELVASGKTSSRYSMADGVQDSGVVTSDAIWIPSTEELTDPVDIDIEAFVYDELYEYPESPLLGLFQLYDDNYDIGSAIEKHIGAPFWTRDAYASAPGGVVVLDEHGDLNYSNCEDENWMLPCFALSASKELGSVQEPGNLSDESADGQVSESSSAEKREGSEEEESDPVAEYDLPYTYAASEKSEAAFWQTLKNPPVITDNRDGHYAAFYTGTPKSAKGASPTGLTRARIEGDKLYMWCSPRYRKPDKDESDNELPYGKYVFQLDDETLYYYYEDGERYVTKREFVNALEEDSYGPTLAVHIVDGVAQSVNFTA